MRIARNSAKAPASSPLHTSTQSRIFATPARPEDVRQSIWHNTCYILASFQTISARHPEHLARMLSQTAAGLVVRHFGMGRPELLKPKTGPRFIPEAITAGQTSVALCEPLSKRTWPKLLRQAYLATTGRGVRFRSYPDLVLHWALGCRVQTALLPQGAARASVLGTLARMFGEGECVVFFVGKHCWSLVGASMQSDGWHLQVSDPRGWFAKAFELSEASRTWDSVHAYTVTFGANTAVRAAAGEPPPTGDEYVDVTHFLLDNAPRFDIGPVASCASWGRERHRRDRFKGAQ